MILSFGAWKDKSRMERSMQKAIDEYQALRKEKGGNFGSFYVSDANELKKIATDKGGINLWDIVFYSLQAGFVIGYKAGLREAKKKQNQKHEDSSKHSKKA